MRSPNALHTDPNCCAFFDVDDTIISVKSMLSFQDYWYQHYPDPALEQRYRSDLANVEKDKACWLTLNQKYYSHFSDREVRKVVSLARQWYLEQINTGHFYHANIVNVLRQHQNLGHTCVFVSGSFPALLIPIAEELNVAHILATQLEEEQGVFTGRVIPPQTIGEGKVTAIKGFLEKQAIAAQNCYAYGDDISDLPMLSHVGNPCVIAGGRNLEAQAKILGWPVLQPQ